MLIYVFRNIYLLSLISNMPDAISFCISITEKNYYCPYYKNVWKLSYTLPLIIWNTESYIYIIHLSYKHILGYYYVQVTGSRDKKMSKMISLLTKNSHSGERSRSVNSVRAVRTGTLPFAGCLLFLLGSNVSQELDDVEYSICTQLHKSSS